MPTVEENLACWSATYNWDERGDEWSIPWGGTPYLWYGTIYPRLLALTPVDSILEIAPGYGRCTQFLQFMCKNLSIVDISERCIENCKSRFYDNKNIAYHVNDGKSLDCIDDNSIDLVFSWDSLVHAEADVIFTYLEQLSNKIKENGYGFIHHSNLGEYLSESGQLTVDNKAWRATSMTAEKFRTYCNEIGMHCVSQEIFKWVSGDSFNDCISMFINKKCNNETTVYVNENFGSEVERINKCSQLFNPKRFCS